MTEPLPSADQFFGTSSTGEKLPSADDFFGPAPAPSFGDRLSGAIGDAVQSFPLVAAARPGLDFAAAAANDVGGMMQSGDIHSSPAMDHFFTTHSVGRVLNAFGQGAVQGWGGQNLLGSIDPDTEKFLRGAGLFNDYAKGQNDLLKSVNEAVIRPALMASTFADPYRIGQQIFAGGSATLAGVQRAAAQTGIEASNTELGHAFDTGAGTLGFGTLKQLGADTAAFLESPEGMGFVSHVPHIELAQARSLGVIGEGEAGYMGTRVPAPEDAAARADAIKEQAAAQPEEVTPTGAPEGPAEATGAPPAAPGTPVPETPDIHTIARQIAPDTFREYDALATRQGTFRRWLGELSETRGSDPRIAAAQSEIDTILGKVNGVEDRLTKKASARLDAIRDEMDDFRTKDTPDMARVRKALQDNDFKMRDLAPDVAKAYRGAQEQIGPENGSSEHVAGAGAEASNTGAVEHGSLQGTTPETAVPVLPGAERTETSPGLQRAGGDNLGVPTVPSGDPSLGKRAGSGSEASGVRSVLPNRPVANIAADISTKLVAAGRPAEEANAAAAIVASHYEARASRLRDTTAVELYGRDAPEIKRGGRLKERELASRTLEQAAYHGTPFRFEKFTMDHIGKGEGAQAYGHGLYFAGKKAVAEFYRDKLASDKFGHVIEYNGKTLARERGGKLEYVEISPSREPEVREFLRVAEQNHLTWPEVRRAMADEHSKLGLFQKLGRGYMREVGAALGDDVKIVDAPPRKGTLYHVDLAPKDDEYLDWDKPLSEQSPAVQKAIKSLTPDRNWRAGDHLFDHDGELQTGEDVYRHLVSRNQPNERTDWTVAYSGFEGQPRASQALLAHGVRGVRYLDQDSRSVGTLRITPPAHTVAGDWMVKGDDYNSRGSHFATEAEARAYLDDRRKKATNNYVIFDPNDITIKELYQGKRGSLTLGDARNTIRLFKDADASTFMHETGHQWLEELMADAVDDRANDAVKADAATVRDWLGVKDGETIPTKAHEKFARGFERYLMEGRAPSKALADVFAKFKAWLTQIYQTVQKLRSPINDDIRDVFDRLVTASPEARTTIAEDATEAKGLADSHEELADATPPERAALVADKIRNEIDDHAEKEAPEIARELNPNGPRRPIEGEPRENETSTSGGDEAGSTTGEDGTPAQSGTVTTGGNSASPQSSIARAVEPEPGTVAEPTDANQRFATPESDLIDKAGNIRLDNLNSTEDVNSVLRMTAERNGDFMSARRGVVSDAQVLEFADAMGVEAKEINIDRLRQISLEDDVPLAARIRAGRDMLIQSAEAVRAAMAGGDELAYVEASQRHLRIQETLSGITAEWGRAGRAFRMRADEAAAAQDLSGFLQQNTGRTLFQIQHEMRRGQLLDTTKKISKHLNDSRKPTFVDWSLEYWINALLSGPMTHVKNMLGNALVAANAVVETALASGVSAVLGSADPVHLVEAKARWFGATQGAVEGLIAAKAILKSEDAIIGSHTVEARPGAIPGKLGEIIRIPTRLLSAEDELFKAIGYRQELNAQAYRTASGEGLRDNAFAGRVAELTQNPTEEMMGLARKNAEYQTFTNSLGPTGRAIQNFANSHPAAKFVVPFIRTPINILKYAGERTPLGALSREVRDNLSGKNGTRARDTQMARMALGTSIVVATTALAAQGLMTGGGPSDPAQRALLRTTGWQPYSIKVGDMYYSYQWAEPFASIAGTVADISDTWHGGEQHGDDWEKIAASVVGGTAKNLLGKLSLRGVSDFINAATNPVQYGGSYIENFTNSFVPGIVAQAERLVDPTLREAHTLTDALKSRVPILSETLMPRRDVWGEPIVNQGSLGPDIGNPIFESRDTKDPVNRELLADGFFPSRLDRKIRGVPLTDRQYDDYSRVAGRTAKMLLNQVVQTQGFASMPLSIRHDIVKKTVEAAREMARNMTMIQNPDIIRAAIQAKTADLRLAQ